MTVKAHGDRKYLTGRRLQDAAEYPSLRIELWRHEPGVLPEVTPECTEIAVMLSGQSKIARTGDGYRQEGVARPGTVWICPTGIRETDIEISSTMNECLHVFLPSTLIEQAALQDYDIDPSKAQLAYAGGMTDPMIHQIGAAFRALLGQERLSANRLFADGMRTALAAHLLNNYATDRWKPSAGAASFDHKRLKRVLDFVEANLSADISLDDLAAEAFLSPFHFARLFKLATGLTPHRYVTERRIQAAKERLARSHLSLVDIALDTGFGSQANFNRVFRKATGLTPGQYRALEAR
ncbi:MAG: AraC family transcriptional regulator [Amphiplicatus sp.]